MESTNQNNTTETSLLQNRLLSDARGMNTDLILGWINVIHEELAKCPIPINKYTPISTKLIELKNLILDSSGWKQIESAPKDEPDGILGFMPSYYQGKGGISVIHWFDGKWRDNHTFATTPSHWMYLPKKP